MQTWRQKATPSGRAYWAHTASARRTSGSDSTGWPTPNAQEFGAADAERLRERRAECKERTGNGNGFGLTLSQLVVLEVGGRPTPDKASGDGGRKSADPLAKTRASGAKKQLTINDAAQLAGWPTPTAVEQKESSEAKVARTGSYEDYRKFTEEGQTSGCRLRAQVHSAGWATPTTRDHKDGACETADVPTNGLLGRQAVRLPTPGPTPSSSPAGTGSAAASPRLNPAFSLWLMGFPPSWMTSGVRAATAFRSRGRSRGASRS